MSSSEAAVVYREIAPLAEGGMARLSTAVRNDGVTVVIKRIRTNLIYNEVYQGLFHDEARIAEALNHQNIVRLLEAGRDQDGPFLVFEHVDGTDLFIVFQNLFQAQQPLELGQFFAIFLPLLSALNAVHEASDTSGESLQLVHRDISPGNVLLSKLGAVKLADFGIAKSVLKTQHTVAGELKGKFAYMAPEQTRGEDLDPRADLFSAGVMMYESLTGGTLFDSATGADTVHAVREIDPPPMHELNQTIPESLSQLVQHLLQKDKNKRPASASDVHAALKECARDLCLDQGHQRHVTFLARNNPRPQLPSKEDRPEEKKRHTQRVLNPIHVAPSPGSKPNRSWNPAALILFIAAIVTISVFFGVDRSVEETLPAKKQPPSRLTSNPNPSFSQQTPPVNQRASSKTDISASESTGDKNMAQEMRQPEPSTDRAASNGQPRAPRAPTKKQKRKENLPTTVQSPTTSSENSSAKGYGKLFLSSEPWSEVTIDGAPVGTHTPIIGLRLSAGTHQVKLHNPHYKIEKKLSITIPKGGEVRRFVDLTK